jgi:uncharacterized protein YggE
MITKIGAVLLLIAGTALSQTRFVRATGQSTVRINPDQAQVTFSVVTQAPTAQDAAGQNATLAGNVIGQLQNLLGASADVRTVNYSLNPNYSYPQNGQPALTGYTASNSIMVTTSDLPNVGKIIDTGIQAGANQVSSLQFTLKDDTSARAQALKQATAQAKSKADAMASGLNLKTGAAQIIEEAGAVTPVIAGGVSAAAPTTPIQSGFVSVSATVTLQVDLTN